MRGVDAQQDGTFSYVALQERVPAEHPLRAMRVLLDDALASISRDFDQVYAARGGGRRSRRSG